MPPSTQGFVALEMLNILEGFDIKAMGHNSADYLHHVTEAKKIAFADRAAYLADRGAMPKDALKTLLSKDYAGDAAQRDRPAEDRHLQAGDRSAAPTSAVVDFLGVDLGDTIYMTAADGQGNVISLIQSLFASSARASSRAKQASRCTTAARASTCKPGHPNQIGPHKRPLHTLVPAMMLKDGKPWVSFGVMGGDNQAQAHAQVVMNLVDFGMNIQDAGEAARMRHGGGELSLESGIGAGRQKGARSARSQTPRRPRRDGRLPGHPHRPAIRRADGRLRSAEGRAGDWVVRDWVSSQLSVASSKRLS